MNQHERRIKDEFTRQAGGMAVAALFNNETVLAEIRSGAAQARSGRASDLDNKEVGALRVGQEGEASGAGDVHRRVG